MTRFIDGPAAGKSFMLRRAPLMLRAVVNAAGDWDALDQPEDTPKPDEKVYVYIGIKGTAHVCSGTGGWKLGADYRLLPDQPDAAHTRTREAWVAWCESARRCLTALHEEWEAP